MYVYVHEWGKDILVIVIHACVVTENHILLPIYV